MALHVAEMETVRQGYAELCRAVRDHGDVVAPRGYASREVHGVIQVRNPRRDAMPHSIGRGLNLAIGACEALQLIGGVATPNLLTRIGAAFDAFKDGEVLAGAYGPRIRWQLSQVVRRLKSDAASRQAILQIYDPAYDSYGETRDVPCTLNLQFALRNDRLDVTVNMRSNDLWWGFAYDVFQFSQLQRVLAEALSVSCGTYTHHATSLHLYERNFDAVDELTEPSDVAILAPALLRLDTSRTIDDWQSDAQRLLRGGRPRWVHDLDDWYGRTLAPYQVRDAGA